MSIQPTEFIAAIIVTGPWVLSAFLLFTLWRVKVKKRHAFMAYKALEERCRAITDLAVKTWPILDHQRGEAYIAVLSVIFKEHAELREAVTGMLRYPGGGIFDPIEAVKYAAAREGELGRVEECLREFDGFRTVTPANRVCELVGWVNAKPGQPIPPARITFLARQLHDIMRALEDAEYPTENPAQTVLQLLNMDRTYNPNPKLEERITKLNAEFRRTIDICAPYALNATFADSLAIYVHTVLEQSQANSFTRGVNHAHRQQLEERRGRKPKLAETLIRAVGASIITATQAEQIGALAKDGEPTGTVVTDGEAS